MIPDVLTFAGFEAAQEATLKSTIEVWPWKSWRSSGLGNPCDRNLVWQFLRWREATPHSTILESVFKLGRLLQPIAEQRLKEMGFEFHTEPYRAEEYRPGGNAVISAKPDVLIVGYKGARFHPPIVGDIKGVQAYAWNHYETIDDFWNSDDYLVRGYATQVNLQMLLLNLPHGALFPFNKSLGLLKCIAFDLDYARAEAAVSRVERLQAMVDQKESPEPISYDSKVCGRCAWEAVCYPPRSYGEGARVIEDARLIEAIETMERCDEAAGEYDAAQRTRNKILEAHGMKLSVENPEPTLAIVGPYVIEGKPRACKSFTVAARTDTIYTVRKAGGQ